MKLSRFDGQTLYAAALSHRDALIMQLLTALHDDNRAAQLIHVAGYVDDLAERIRKEFGLLHDDTTIPKDPVTRRLHAMIRKAWSACSESERIK